MRKGGNTFSAVAQDHSPPTLPEFVARYVPSIETLEVLLLLFQGRDRAWTVEAVQGEIRSSIASITKNLRDLVAAGLAVLEGGKNFRFQSPSPEIEGQISALAVAYRSRRVSVIELIYRDRTDPLREFSDAFKIRPPHDR